MINPEDKTLKMIFSKLWHFHLKDCVKYKKRENQVQLALHSHRFGIRGFNQPQIKNSRYGESSNAEDQHYALSYAVLYKTVEHPLQGFWNQSHFYSEGQM